ncbi:MAG: flagellin, partial [Clostridiales bacterium]|nr:flagellin [Clostridiales bacterium]
MKINNNMSAVVANVRLLRTENKLTQAVERLSSGYKINKPGDNPSGMAISNKMRQQIAALDQAETNANNAVSTLQIADGALGEVSDILQRIRELSVQAANGTNSYSDRQSMQAEIDQLVQEVDRISEDTEYNTKTLLNGSSDICTYSDQASRIYTSSEVTAGIYEMTVSEMAETASYTFTTDQLAAADASGTITINDVTMSYSPSMSEEEFYETLRNTAEEAGCVATRETDDDGNVTGYSVETMMYGSAS